MAVGSGMDESYRRKMARLHELRSLFQESHRRGMNALESGDLDALDAAIKLEAEIIKEQGWLVSELRYWSARLE